MRPIKLITLILLPALLASLAALAWLGFSMHDNARLQYNTAQLHTRAQAAAQQFGARIELYRFALRSAVKNPNIISILEKNTHVRQAQPDLLLTELRDLLPHVTELTLLNAEGKTLASSASETAVQLNLSEHDFYPVIRPTEESISTPAPGKISGKPSFFMTEPVLHEKKTIGTLVAVINLATLGDSILKNHSPPQLAFLAGPESITYYHTNPQLYFESIKHNTLPHAANAHIPHTRWIITLLP